QHRSVREGEVASSRYRRRHQHTRGDGLHEAKTRRLGSLVEPKCPIITLTAPITGTALHQHHPARMSLRAEHNSLIATAYDSAAFDVSLPAHTRAAFAKKRQIGFHLLARVGEKKRASGTRETKKPRNHSPTFSRAPARLLQAPFLPALLLARDVSVLPV